MALTSRSILSDILKKLLGPIVRFCMRHAIRHQDLHEFTKAVFLEEAAKEIQRNGGKVTASRLSAITGLQRRDVSKYEELEIKLDDTRDLIRKVIGAWQASKKYKTKSGSPRVLTHGTDDSEFSSLVKSVSRDLNAATILFELERIEVVEKTSYGVRLVLDSISPRDNPAEGFQIVSDDIHDLLNAVEENIFEQAPIPNLHVRTIYDRIRAEAVPEIKRWLLKEGHVFHAKAREYISQYDQDINPSASFRGKVSTVVVNSFSRSETDTRKKGSLK